MEIFGDGRFAVLHFFVSQVRVALNLCAKYLQDTITRLITIMLPRVNNTESVTTSEIWSILHVSIDGFHLNMIENDTCT